MNVSPQQVPSFKASLLIDFIYLDLYERTKFTKENHFYLIEQIQKNGDCFYDKNDKNPRVKLNFYHPVKELLWVFQRSDVLIPSDDVDGPKGNDWFNFTKSINFESKEDFFDTCILKINSMERFKCLPAKYFRLLQPYKHHTKCPNNMVYCYSFAIKPEEHQPTGTCNFSNFDNSILEFDLRSKKNPSNYLIKVYAVNYNLLVITNGMVGLGFSC